MTTRLELRTTLRRRLSDPVTNPLWEDDFLNDAIAEAIRRYSVPARRQAVAALPVTTGDRELEVPEDVNTLHIIRVFDDQGVPWRRWDHGEPPPVPVGYPAGSSIWRSWGTTVILGTPAPRTGLWRLEHLANRVEPFDDIADLDIQPGDEDVILIFAIAIALDRRAVAEGKRYTGRAGMHPLAIAARHAQASADTLLWRRLRNIRSGMLNVELS